MTRGKLFILVAIFALLSLFSILAVYFTHQLPTERIETTTLYTYKHTGTYDYIAKLKSNIIYNQSELEPGEGFLYMGITEYINTTLYYRFESSRDANVTIQYSVDVILASPKWSKIFDSTPQTTLNSVGNVTTFSSNYLVDIASIWELKNLIEGETGARATDYNVTIRPEIHTIASNNITTVNEAFTPKMTMTFQHGTAVGNYILVGGLEHIRPKEIVDTQRISMPGVMYQRYASYGFCAITLPALAVTTWAFARTLKPSFKPEKPMDEVIMPYEEIIAESAGEPTYEAEKTAIKMKSLEDLVKVADLLIKPVLSYEKAQSTTSKKSTRVFYIIDGTTRYEFTITAPTPTGEEETESD
ncbi:MAG: hypothetical protein GTO54_07095 [Nitrososphaeria archaeon]|nr:hypothetical protein [Nitrososphaeria archaeon]